MEPKMEYKSKSQKQYSDILAWPILNSCNVSDKSVIFGAYIFWGIWMPGSNS